MMIDYLITESQYDLALSLSICTELSIVANSELLDQTVRLSLFSYTSCYHFAMRQRTRYLGTGVRFSWVNVSIWLTALSAHPPSPNPTLTLFFLSSVKCYWVRGGVGTQILFWIRVKETVTFRNFFNLILERQQLCQQVVSTQLIMLNYPVVPTDLFGLIKVYYIGSECRN